MIYKAIPSLLLSVNRNLIWKIVFMWINLHVDHNKRFISNYYKSRTMIVMSILSRYVIMLDILLPEADLSDSFSQVNSA